MSVVTTLGADMASHVPTDALPPERFLRPFAAKGALHFRFN